MLFRSVEVKKGDRLRAGDILASSDHVIMVDNVGSDPFGISNIKSIAGCTAGAVNSKNFRFTIVQSAPVLGGIGINRMNASDYLSSGDMEVAINGYALAYCRAKFSTALTPTNLPATLVRHLGTSECKDKRISLKYENCMESCGVSEPILY